MKNLHVYRGQSAVNDFLNPENHLTPLVELSEKLNPFIADQVHIYIKLQTFLPLMNIKSIPAYEMLKQDMSPTKKDYRIVFWKHGFLAVYFKSQRRL